MFDLVALGGLIVEFVRTEANQPLDEIHPFMGPYPSGASAITISTAARLGLRTAFVGIVGDDLFGTAVVRRMRNDGVDLGHLEVVKGLNTGLAFLMYSSDGSRKYNYVVDYSRVSLATPKLDIATLPGSRWIHANGTMFGDKSIWKTYGMEVIRKVLSDGGSLSFDANFRPELMDMNACRNLYEPIIRLSRYFLPSEEEILAFFDTNDMTVAISRALELGPEIVCVKCGSKGCIVASRDSGQIVVPGFKVISVDPTGAGDSFNAAFICARERGLPLWESARFANAVGAFAVTKHGPMEGCPWPEDLRTIIAPEEATTLLSMLAKG